VTVLFLIWILSTIACVLGSGISATRLERHIAQRENRGGPHERRNRAEWDALLFNPNNDQKIELNRISTLRWFMAFLIVGLGGAGPIVFIVHATNTQEFPWVAAPVVGAIAIAAAMFAIWPLGRPTASSVEVLIHATVGIVVAFLAVVIALWS
jgi:hypothetical protein